MSVENSRQSLGDLLDDGAELGVAVLVALAQLVRAEIDLGEQPLKGALEGFVLDVLEALLQGVEQFAVLGAGQVGDAAPEMVRLDDIMHLAAHLLFELGHVVGVVRIPDRQRHPPVVARWQFVGVIRPQFLLRRRLVVVREVAQEQEGQHVIAEIVRVHRPAQLVGDAPEGFAQLFLV